MLNKFNHLTSLNLMGTTVISTVERMTNLRVLDISSSSVSCSSLSALPNLTDLNVSRNPTITDEYLSSCTNLKRLTVSGTSVTALSLSRLTSLTYYRGPIILQALGNLTNIMELIINPPDCDLGLTTIAVLTNLKNLTKTSVPYSEALSSLTSLKHISLKHARMGSTENVAPIIAKAQYIDIGSSTIAPEILLQFTNLTHLSIANENVQESLALLTNITHLSLEQVTIEDQTVISLPKLRSLRVCHNAISGRAFLWLTNLSSLHLIGNSSVTDDALKTLSSLTELWLDRTVCITGGGVERMLSLEKLTLVRNEQIHWEHISRLTNLTEITAGAEEFPLEILFHLPKLASVFRP